MRWRGKLARIAAAEASYAGVAPSERLETVGILVGLTGDGDPIVGFAAKEALARLLGGKSAATIGSSARSIVRRLLEEAGDPHGFRLALLRLLIHGGSEDDRESCSEEDDGDDSVEPSDVFLDAVLHDMALVEARVSAVFRAQSSEPQQHEALVFLSVLLRLVGSRYASARGSAAARFVPLLCGWTRRFVETVVVPLDYEDAPSSVACGVLDVLDAWHELVQAAGNGGDDYSRECASCSVQWLVGSSCTSVALSMVQVSEAEAETASENAFVARQNQFPFLQKWLQVLGRVATSVVDALDGWEGDSDLPVLQLRCWLQRVEHDAGAPLALPSRNRILAILSEQDDVMVQVLSSITYTFVKMEQRGGSDSSDATACSNGNRLVEHLLAEFDPDLLFVDLLGGFAFDHLVLLDFVTSSGTFARAGEGCLQC